MANLPSIAQRLNDVEINNNAPVSSQTFRRVGSDVNYLLDYLGIDNGDTIGGPVTGLNVFSPPQSLSFSRAFTNADVGIDVALFTYTGGGDRPLKFFKRDSGFQVPEYEFTLNYPTVVLAAPPTTANYRFINRNPSTTNPLHSLCWQLNQTNGITGSFQIKVNGILMATVVRLGAITLNRDIIFSPAGTNTVTVRVVPGSAITTTQVIADSFEYVAL